MLRKFATAIAVAALAIPSLAQAQSIRVEQECGFSYAPCGAGLLTLLHDGPEFIYTVVNDEVTNSFSLAYRGDFFVMTALEDNWVREGAFLPFGFAVYGGTGPLIRPDDDDSTALGFISVFSFPMLEGRTARVFVPPSAVVSESGSLALMLAGLGAVGLVARRRRG